MGKHQAHSGECAVCIGLSPSCGVGGEGIQCPAWPGLQYGLKAGVGGSTLPKVCWGCVTQDRPSLSVRLLGPSEPLPLPLTAHEGSAGKSIVGLESRALSCRNSGLLTGQLPQPATAHLWGSGPMGWTLQKVVLQAQGRGGGQRCSHARSLEGGF